MAETLVRLVGRYDSDAEFDMGLKVVEGAQQARPPPWGMKTIIGLIIACAGVGVLAITMWFWLTDPERSLSARDPQREAFYDRAAWVCLLIGLGAVGLGLLLALAG
jgi:hypothetical protein